MLSFILNKLWGFELTGLVDCYCRSLLRSFISLFSIYFNNRPIRSASRSLLTQFSEFNTFFHFAKLKSSKLDFLISKTRENDRVIQLVSLAAVQRMLDLLRLLDI